MRAEESGDPVFFTTATRDYDYALRAYVPSLIPEQLVGLKIETARSLMRHANPVAAYGLKNEEGDIP